MRTPWSDDPNSAGFSPEDHPRLEVDTSGDEPVVLDHRVFHGFIDMTGMQEYLADQVRAESVLLEWLKAHPTYSKRRNRWRRKVRSWLELHWPTVHVGPCDHRDCY